MLSGNLQSLDHNFYVRKATIVARELLGKKLVFNNFSGIITETEAYRGADDPASHAYRGKTKRTEVMFGPPGYSYIYLIYGMYYCLNIVVETEERAAAVLIRGMQIVDGYFDGPGKLCRYLQLTTAHNAINIMQNDSFYVTSGIEVKRCGITSRVGIKRGQDKLWRFVMDSAQRHVLTSQNYE